MAWLLAKPIVSSIIVGASKIHQLEDNLKACDIELNADEVRALDELTNAVTFPSLSSQYKR